VIAPLQVIRFSKMKLCMPLVLGLAIIAAGIWCAVEPRYRQPASWLDEAFGIAGIALGAVLVVLAVRRLFGDVPALLFDQEGMVENSQYGSVGRILWSDIAGVEVIEEADFAGVIGSFFKQKFVVIGVHRPEEFAARVAARESRLMRFLKRAAFIRDERRIRIPTIALDVTATELADIIKRWIAQMKATPASGSGDGPKF
jgi:hypothetical protein